MAKKFFVKAAEVHVCDIEVDAEDENQAREKAAQLIEELEYEAVYDYTLDPDSWSVWEAE